MFFHHVILWLIGLLPLQVGKTKVFLRAGQMAELDARRGEILGVSAIVIQRKVRAYLSRRRFHLLRLSSIKLQAFCRGNKHFILCICDSIISYNCCPVSSDLFVFPVIFYNLVAGQAVRHQYARMRRAAACLNIQKHSRKFLGRKAYKNLYFSSVTIQAGIRGMIARDKLLFRKQIRAVTVIQVKTKILSINEILIAQILLCLSKKSHFSSMKCYLSCVAINIDAG